MQAKKSLGQNWLLSRSVAQKAVESARLTEADTVIEIGPGKGFLTEFLLEKAGKVIAVEKDRELIQHLKERFTDEIMVGKLALIEADIADYQLGHEVSKYKVVANIPYYLTGMIIRQFLEAETQPELMVLMLQKEVADRLVARDGKEGLLSISVKVFGQPKLITKVPAKFFRPRPKVDSALLLIDKISRQALDTWCPLGHQVSKFEQQFFKILKQGFAHKRKLLKSNLNCSTELLAQVKIKPKARPENLTLDQWLHLTTLIIASKKPSIGS